MSITSNLNIGLPAAPLADDPNLNGELQIIYNALRIMAQALNDAGIPSGGATPSPSVLDVANGGTGAATLTGIVKATGTSAFTAITSSTAGHILSCTGANTYAFAAPVIGTNVNIADAAGDTTCWILMAGGGATGSQPVLSDTGLTYNATTNALSATAFVGALTGTASGNLTSAAIGVTVQAYDADLTTWAGITPGTGVATLLATPSSANLRAALTDETGTGAAVFADAPSFVSLTDNTDPSVAWSVAKGASTLVSILDNGTYDLAAGSGFVMIYEDAGYGSAYAFTAFGSTVLTNIAGTAFTTTLGGAGTVNFAYNGGTGKYRLENKSGATRTFYLTTIMARTSS